MNKEFNKFIEDIKGKRVAVLGIGVSNQPLIRYIVKAGAKVTACDKKPREVIGSVCDEFEAIGVNLILGPDYLNNLNGFDIIFRSPSLRPDISGLKGAAQNGAYVTSEIEEFIKYCPGMVIGVTGSAGKTTTTTLIYNMLSEEGYKTWLGGNIGIPLFDKLNEISEDDKVVLELSSFQLMDMDVSPHIAIITNLSPNHLDIHKSMEEYVDSKKNIFRYQNSKDILVLNYEDDLVRNMEQEAAGSVRFISSKRFMNSGAYLKNDKLILTVDGNESEICSTEEVKLLGMHNIENILAAAAAIGSICSADSIRKAAVAFTGVKHRMEFVRDVAGVKYYNDSIATSPDRVAAGLNAYDQRVILIAGGYDKKLPFDMLARAGVKKVKLLILMGVTAKKIEDAFIAEMEKTGVSIPIIHVDSLDSAVETAKRFSKAGDIVTLSPACASFDMYKDFEERGDRFRDIVNKL